LTGTSLGFSVTVSAASDKVSSIFIWKNKRAPGIRRP
jgi:hypothetical protein